MTVWAPLMLCLRCTAQAQFLPDSTSRTHCSLNPSLYRITFMALRFALSKVPTYFRTGPPLPFAICHLPSAINARSSLTFHVHARRRGGRTSLTLLPTLSPPTTVDG